MRHGGFSLVEISIVLVVVATMLAGVLPVITETTKVRDLDATQDRMVAIEEAVQAYYNMNNELPCPSDITLGVNTGNFGIQAANDTCIGGTPAANWNSGGNVVGGGVPTKTLGLPDEFAFDGWGRRIYYHVDPDATVAATFSDTTTGTIRVNDATGAARSTTGVYALVSAGRNGHGAFLRAGGTARMNSGSVNVDEHENCQTTGTVCAGTAAAYNGTLVQKMESATNPNDPATRFDDILIYKLKGHLMSGNTTQSQGGKTTRMTAASIAAGAFTAGVQFDAALNTATIDTLAGANPGANRIDIPSSGPYLVQGAATFCPQTTHYSSLLVTRNGATILDSGTAVAGGCRTNIVSDVVVLSSGDQIKLRLFDSVNGPTMGIQGIYLSVTALHDVAGSGGGGGGGSFWADAGSNNINNTNSGNVGIGTAAPTSKLVVSDGTNNGTATVITQTNTTASNGLFITTATANTGDSALHVLSSSGAIPVLVARNSGNVGLGTTVPSYKLHVVHANAAQWVATFNNTGIYTQIAHGQYGLHSYVTNPSAIGTYGYAAGASSIGNLSYANAASSHAFLAQNLSSGYYCYIGYANTHSIVCSGPASIPSDRRLKKDVVPLASKEGLDAIMVLRPVHYRWKDERRNAAGHKQVGFIAQEVEKVYPNLVSEVREPGAAPKKPGDTIGKPGPLRKALEYDGFIPHLVLAMQQLNAKVDALAEGKPLPAVVKEASVPEAAAKAGVEPKLALHQLPHWLLIALAAPWFAIGMMAWRMRRPA